MKEDVVVSTILFCLSTLDLIVIFASCHETHYCYIRPATCEYMEADTYDPL